MKTIKHALIILGIIGINSCDSSSIDNSYDDGYFEESTGGKESWEIDYEEEIPERVKLRESRMPDKYILKLELWSTLPDVLKGMSFKYGVRSYWEEKTNSGHWLTRAEDYYLTLDEMTEYVCFDNFINGIDVDYTMYLRVYNTLKEKLSSGETLTESEKRLWEQVNEVLQERIENFTYDIFVEIYGEKYPVNGSWEEDVQPK